MINRIKTIRKAYGMVDKIWKKEYREDIDYIPLPFLIFRDCDDGLLIHNALSGELILINPDDWKSPSPDVRKELAERHFLVAPGNDMRKYVEQLRVLLSMALRKTAMTKFTVLPTSCCNARCFYCFESDYPQHSMQREIADKTVDFMIQKSGGGPITVAWFGGEPMVGSKTIDYICEKLRGRGIKFVSTMISNGYLFSEEIARRAARDWKLERIQITLDGTEEVYNRTKNYKQVPPGESPFERVLDNIGYLTENGVKVSIRLNMSAYNKDDIKELIRQLTEKFKGNKLIHIYSMLLFENTGFEPVSFDKDTNEKLYGENRAINTMLAGLGFQNKHSSLPVLKYASCMADGSATMIINPLGKIAKCEQHCMDYLVGDLENGITDNQNIKYWKEKISYDLCAECELYPSCCKLAHCDSAVSCKDFIREDKLGECRNSMEYYYKKYKESDKTQDYTEETTDFYD